MKYKKPEELQEAVDGYFKRCEGVVVTDQDGKPMIDRWGKVMKIDAEPPTVTGLALWLGFTGRQSLLNYQGKKQFQEIIEKAKSRCEAYTEKRLFDREGNNGARFSLKYNFRWGQEEETTLEAIAPGYRAIMGEVRRRMREVDEENE